MKDYKSQFEVELWKDDHFLVTEYLADDGDWEEDGTVNVDKTKIDYIIFDTLEDANNYIYSSIIKGLSKEEKDNIIEKLFTTVYNNNNICSEIGEILVDYMVEKKYY